MTLNMTQAIMRYDALGRLTAIEVNVMGQLGWAVAMLSYAMAVNTKRAIKGFEILC